MPEPRSDAKTPGAKKITVTTAAGATAGKAQLTTSPVVVHMVVNIVTILGTGKRSASVKTAGTRKNTTIRTIEDSECIGSAHSSNSTGVRGWTVS